MKEENSVTLKKLYSGKEKSIQKIEDEIKKKRSLLEKEKKELDELSKKLEFAVLREFVEKLGKGDGLTVEGKKIAVETGVIFKNNAANAEQNQTYKNTEVVK